MKKQILPIASILLLIPFIFGMNVEPLTLKTYNISIKGTSTLHNWESKVEKAKVNADLVLKDNKLEAINSLYLEIESQSIRSPKGSAMDKKTWEALKTETYPNISYRLIKVISLERVGNEYTIKSSGLLTIAGANQTIELNTKGTLTSDGGIVFKGSKKLNMSDFQVEPPTALMGTVKAGNEISIDYEVSLKK